MAQKQPSEVSVVQAWGPEFHPQNPHRKLGCDGMYQESQAWGSGTKRIGSLELSV